MKKIELVNISKKFDNDLILDKINLNVEAGELVALLGPSGCGKTTTLKLIAGLLGPDQGDILFGEKSVLNTKVEKRSSVLVFQDYLLFPHMTVRDNIAFGLKMRGVSKAKREAKAESLLEMVDLPGYSHYYPHEISGGQKQRVSLARALAIDPEVLLLDEPLSNLDYNLREDMQNLILELHNKNDMTTIFVTHDHEEAMLLSDKIAIMNKGKVEQYGSGEEIYKKPVNKFVADFFGTANYIKGRIEKGSFYFNSTKIPLKNQFNECNKNEINTAMIRPENIEINSKVKNGINLKAEIIERKFIGGKLNYRFKLKNGHELVASTFIEDYNILNEKCNLSVKFENIWFMAL